ncbi:spermidine synthase [Leucobacter sp. NPDC015123]|uniref:spermidine synthase n=1 Tax=Leucobacter sp. NPDC015123 TaxID=3364129 RepID=UPI0036F45245
MLKKRRTLSSTLSGRSVTLTSSRLRPGRFELSVDGVAQSVVSLSDPTKLAYPYTRHIARAIDAAAPSGAPLFTVHLGAGALTLARYVQATRAGSPQLVVEFEPELYATMLDALPLPEGSDVRAVFGDAREVAEAASASEAGRAPGPAPGQGPAQVSEPESQQVSEPEPAPQSRHASQGDAGRTATPTDWAEAEFTIVDLWDAAVIHRRVASREFFALVAARSAAGGAVVVNLLDGHPFEYARTQAATLGDVFAHVAVVLDADPLDADGPLGNVLIFASDAPLAVAADPDLLGLPRPHLLCAGQLAAWVGDARVMTDGDGAESPDPNDPRWG